MDLNLAGGNYSWRRGKRHSTTAKLDRFMVLEDWDSTFRNIKPSVMQRIVSDNALIFL